MAKQNKKWKDLSTKEKAGAIVVGTAQFALTAYAGWDLAKRPQEEVNGPKGAWAAALAVNWIGPGAYLLFGRRK